jgi:dienelactone hydrolase
MNVFGCLVGSPSGLRIVAALLAVLAWSGLADAARARGAESGGGAAANYELLAPQGGGPFPAVVVMHGCDGVNANTRAWAARLVGWGYAALIVDSFRSRGLSNVCNRGAMLPASVRAGDATAAKNYLRSLPNIAKGRIGLIGFSHGGWAALAAASSFNAVVAYYPLCSGRVPANTLVLIGSADDWTPSQRCSGGGANLKVYSGATHAFDAPRGDRTYLGHRMAYDAAAATDAEERTRRFLASRLGR